MFVVLCPCDHSPWQKRLIGGEVYLGSRFQSVSVSGKVHSAGTVQVTANLEAECEPGTRDGANCQRLSLVTYFCRRLHMVIKVPQPLTVAVAGGTKLSE